MDNIPGTCEYEHWYTDTRTGKYEEYFCNRSCTHNSQYCLFHDDNYFQTHEHVVKDEFYNELNNRQRRESEPIFFIGCNIPAIDIWNINQNRAVYFTNTTFHGDVNFSGIQFRTVDFSSAKLHGDFQATNMDVSEIFLFSKVRLESTDSKIEFKICNFNIGNFSLTNFQTISFNNCKLNFTKFRTCTFEKKISLKDCNLRDKTDFTDCKFLGESIFYLTSFHTNTSFLYASFQNPIKFHNVDFKEQQLITFGVDLSNISFIGTDITRIKFDGSTIWGKDDRYAIFDARELINNPQEFSLSSVLAVYRNLRENYEFQLMYEEAGQFFVKEMELKRIYFQDSNDDNKTKIKEWRRYFSVTNCYNILSNYGESFKRVSLWSIALFSSALVYFFISPDIIALNQSKPLGDIDYVVKLSEDPIYRLEISLERTFGSFFQISNVGLADYLVRISSLPILGTMFIVLRRRFERRFRH